MSGKRLSNSLAIGHPKRRKSREQLSYFQTTLQECGLIVKKPPEKCEMIRDTVYIVRDLKKSLKQHEDYPHNIETFLSEFKRACNDKETFEHYLFLNIVSKTQDKTYNVDNSIIKILLNVTFLQNELINYIYDKLIDTLDKPDFSHWMKMTLKSFSNLDMVESSAALSVKLINLLDVSSDKFVQLEIISAIPDIIGDQEHDNVAVELGRMLSNDTCLIPSILDCLTYLCLSDLQFEWLQKETLNLLQPSNAVYFSNFVKFLLTPERLSDNAYEETIKGLRKELGWSTEIGSEEEIATSQILTAREIRNSMLSSKTVTKAWIKVISSCTSQSEHTAIDIIIFLIIATLSDDKEKQVENIMRKQIKLQVLKEELLNKAFKIFKPILKKNIMTLISLANSLLKPGADPLVEAFGAHMHMVMFSELTECRTIIVSELLQLVLNCRKSSLNTLNILNNIASEHLSLMKQQSNQMLILLDRLDEMTLIEIRAVMNLVCGLAYSFDDSIIRDELHIIIRKELGSSIPSIKTQGILAGIHAVKYLMKCTTTEGNIQEDVSLNMTDCLPSGDIRSAAQIIELIHHSTAQFPDMIALFYNELHKVIRQIDIINEDFLVWLTYALTNYWQQNFLVDTIGKETIGDIKLSMQLCVNLDSEVDKHLGVNIAGLALDDNKENNVKVLSSLFKLISVLLLKKERNLIDIDVLLGCPVVMPIVDIDSITDLSESTSKKILECYIDCVNWIRELLNVFVSQEDDVLKPKILIRISQLQELEKAIDKIRDKRKNPEHDDTTIAGSTRSQQTQMTQMTKSKLTTKHNTHFGPWDLSLINVIRFDLTPLNATGTEITFQNLRYFLNYINISLAKVLVPRIKKKTYLNKDVIEVYNFSEAETQAKAIKSILQKLMTHVDLIIKFLHGHVIEEGRIVLETEFYITDGLLCLEYIYDLLTIYFSWIGFRNRNHSLLKSSMQIVAKIKEDKNTLEELVIVVATAFQKHETYIITISSAASLMKFMKTLQELSSGPEVPTILKNMALKFLSKQWKTIDDQIEKGLFYNQCLDSLTKVYLDNNELIDLENIVSSLVDEVENVRDRTSTLSNLKSINKGNFYIIFRNLGAALLKKIKCHLNGGSTNQEHVEMWHTVANILKLMSDIVKSLGNKNTSSHFLKKSMPILNLFLSKGFPILNIEFKVNRQTILNVLKDFRASTECLQNICSQSSHSGLMQKIPGMEELLAGFIYKTKDLLKANDCLETLKMFNVRDVPDPSKKSNKNTRKFVQPDVTVEDTDDDFPDDESDNLNEVLDYINVDSIGNSELI